MTEFVSPSQLSLDKTGRDRSYSNLLGGVCGFVNSLWADDPPPDCMSLDGILSFTCVTGLVRASVNFAFNFDKCKNLKFSNGINL
jgi:hypothetical protein